MTSDVNKKAVELHRAAMQHMDAAQAARRAGKAVVARRATERALSLECDAASLVEEEPTRSVLRRSAAAMALGVGAHRTAERMIASALAGDPPEEIANELRDLLEQVYFSRHLDVRGMRLTDDQFQMSLAGNEVSFGMARSERFLKRVDDMRKLILRTAGRVANDNFDETTKTKEPLEVYVSVPRAASFAVSFRIARPKDQEPLPTMAKVKPEAVVAELLECFDLLNQRHDAALRARFPNQAYYRNFIALARQIAPDGLNVRLVGLTAGQNHRRVEFIRVGKSIATLEPNDAQLGFEEHIGRLLFADERKRSVIKIVSPGKQQQVFVPQGMMADIVRPLWGTDVVATVTREGKKATLLGIRRLTET
jgi:hypothetical protein